MRAPKPKHKGISYSKYGYRFILPFFLVYLVFSLWPLLSTFYYSLFEYTTRNLVETSRFAGLENYGKILGLVEGEKANFLLYLGNTVRIWICNFIPQILMSLLVAAWLTDNRVELKGKGVFKVLTYMPNIITAASVSMVFYALLCQYGPVMTTLRKLGWVAQSANIMSDKWATSLTISFILFWMWYGNTTLILISGMMGINRSLRPRRHPARQDHPHHRDGVFVHPQSTALLPDVRQRHADLQRGQVRHQLLVRQQSAGKPA